MTDLASFNWRDFGRAMLSAVRRDGRGLAPAARDAGVTITSLSRATSGIRVGTEAVFAMADWAGLDPREFYAPPAKSNTCSWRHVKHPEAKHHEQ